MEEYLDDLDPYIQKFAYIDHGAEHYDEIIFTELVDKYDIPELSKNEDGLPIATYRAIASALSHELMAKYNVEMVYWLKFVIMFNLLKCDIHP